ncbi:hypothetical protein CEXT_355741 [Caerostris extrusa]|uniref:Uncharacterized protein n=1 Tax=Caerostris extrusa TaxID=172846 RepID=A0AAV4MCZ5_CAEEX|nr:hypothetical protein CEXT_355741 [Caerostris extrusa]
MKTEKVPFTYIWAVENYSEPIHLTLQSPSFVVDSIEDKMVLGPVCQPSLRSVLHCKTERQQWTKEHGDRLRIGNPC